MRRLAFSVAILLIVANGCVISPRRTTVGNNPGGGGGTSEFTLSANPPSQVITAGSNGTYTISVTAQNGFTGSVTLSSSAATSNVVSSFDTTTITGGSGSATLTVTTSSSTPSGNVTITVTATDTNTSVSQNITVIASVQGGAASTMAGVVSASGAAAVPAGCVNAHASSNTQRVSFPTAPDSHGFTATFAATPSTSEMDASLGFFTSTSTQQSSLSGLINFGPDGVIQVRDGDRFVPSTVTYAAGQTYLFRLVLNLPAATYSLFVTPPGAAEIPLGANLQVPSDQRGATSLKGLGILVNSPDNTTLSVCNLSLH